MKFSQYFSFFFMQFVMSIFTKISCAHKEDIFETFPYRTRSIMCITKWLFRLCLWIANIFIQLDDSLHSGPSRLFLSSFRERCQRHQRNHASGCAAESCQVLWMYQISRHQHWKKEKGKGFWNKQQTTNALFSNAFCFLKAIWNTTPLITRKFLLW